MKMLNGATRRHLSSINDLRGRLRVYRIRRYLLNSVTDNFRHVLKIISGSPAMQVQSHLHIQINLSLNYALIALFHLPPLVFATGQLSLQVAMIAFGSLDMEPGRNVPVATFTIWVPCIQMDSVQAIHRRNTLRQPLSTQIHHRYQFGFHDIHFERHLLVSRVRTHFPGEVTARGVCIGSIENLLHESPAVFFLSNEFEFDRLIEDQLSVLDVGRCLQKKFQQYNAQKSIEERECREVCIPPLYLGAIESHKTCQR